MVNKRIILLLVSLLFFLPTVFSEEVTVTNTLPDEVFKQGQLLDIKVPCISNNSYCDATTSCNITIIRPDTAVWINNALMTRNVAFYNYTIPASNVSVIGTYKIQIICTNGVNKGYDLGEFQITSSGMSGIGQETIVPAVVLIAILLFCVFMAWQLPEEEHPIRLLFIGLALFMLLIMLQYANLATNEDAAGLTDLLNMTYTILLPVVTFIIGYFIIVKFLAPLLNKLNKTYKERKQGKE
jgi:hypothetical protein